MVKLLKRHGETVEQRQWNSGTMMVEQWNNEKMNSDGGTREDSQSNSATVMVEQWNNDATEKQ